MFGSCGDIMLALGSYDHHYLIGALFGCGGNVESIVFGYDRKRM
jgi:hypothetical protein